MDASGGNLIEQFAKILQAAGDLREHDYEWASLILKSHRRGSRPLDSTAVENLRDIIRRLKDLESEDVELALRIVKAHCQGITVLDNCLVQSIEKALANCPPSERELDWFARLIRAYQKGVRVRDHGPCLNCRKEMQYQAPSKSHQQRGDVWLDRVFSRWKIPPEVGPRRIGEWSPETVAPYLCESCYKELQSIASQQTTRLRDEAERQAEERALVRRQRRQAIVEGTVDAHPQHRFRILCDVMTLQQADELRLMPYPAFLQTPYWSAVRNYVVWLRNGRCQLCLSRTNLNVHHPPQIYGMRGYEYQNPEELVVLCQPCHAKFHDKFAEE